MVSVASSRRLRRLRPTDSGPDPLASGSLRLEQKRITIHRKEVALGELVDQAFAGSGLQYSLGTKARAIRVSVDAENQPLGKVVRAAVYDALRREPRLELVIDGNDVLVIRQHPPIPPEATRQP